MLYAAACVSPHVALHIITATCSFTIASMWVISSIRDVGCVCVHGVFDRISASAQSHKYIMWCYLCVYLRSPASGCLLSVVLLVIFLLTDSPFDSFYSIFFIKYV